MRRELRWTGGWDIPAAYGGVWERIVFCGYFRIMALTEVAHALIRERTLLRMFRFN